MTPDQIAFHRFLQDPKTGPRLDAALADCDRIDRGIADRQRICPVCSKPATLESTGPDGLKSYMCPNGDLFLVTPTIEG